MNTHTYSQIPTICQNFNIIHDSLYAEKFQSPAVNMSLIGQCPMLRFGGPIIFPSLFHIGLRPIKHNKQSFLNKNQTCPYPLGLGFEIKRKKYKSCTKISSYRHLNAWRMEITTCAGNFFLQNNIFSNGS